MRTTLRHFTSSRWLLAGFVVLCLLCGSAPALAQSSDTDSTPAAESTGSTGLNDASKGGSDDTEKRPRSESSPRDDEVFFGASHRERMYQQSKLSHTRALLYTLAFPGIGNIYAEQYFLAGLAFSLMAFTTMFVLYGATTQQPQFVHMGLVTGGVAYTGGALSSYLGVRAYNKRLRQGFNLSTSTASPSPFDAPRVRTIGVKIRF